MFLLCVVALQAVSIPEDVDKEVKEAREPTVPSMF